MRRVSLVLMVLFFSWQTNAKNACQENRGAFDFGSGTTKAVVALVDVCEKKIIQIVYEERIALALNEAFEKSASQEIPFSVFEGKFSQLKNLVDKIKLEMKVTKVSAVATSVFRMAKNGKAITKQLSQKLNIPIKIITQEREAELGYWSVLASQKSAPSQQQIIVWDIGGGSMQMYSQAAGKVHIYQGELASVTFKNKILEVLQFKNPKEHSSPNPIGGQRLAAVQLAKNHAYLNVPSFFKKNAQKSYWVGVGGVLAMSVQKQVSKEHHMFTQEALAETLKNKALLKDSEIDSEYRISDVSNLALVLGHMQALGIQKVETVQSSLGQGLLYYNLHH